LPDSTWPSTEPSRNTDRYRVPQAGPQRLASSAWSENRATRLGGLCLDESDDAWNKWASCESHYAAERRRWRPFSVRLTAPRHLTDRQTYKANRSAALAEWQNLMAW